MAEKKFSITPNLIYKEEEGDAVVCNPETFDLVMLNESGNFIWKLLGKGLDRDKIINEMLERYSGTDRAVVEKDVDNILNRLSIVKVII